MPDLISLCKVINNVQTKPYGLIVNTRACTYNGNPKSLNFNNGISSVHSKLNSEINSLVPNP